MTRGSCRAAGQSLFVYPSVRCKAAGGGPAIFQCPITISYLRYLFPRLLHIQANSSFYYCRHASLFSALPAIMEDTSILHSLLGFITNVIFLPVWMQAFSGLFPMLIHYKDYLKSVSPHRHYIYRLYINL